MRSMLTATLIFVATIAVTKAQTPPSTAIKPKQIATVPVRPGLQSPADTANSMGQSERMSIQADLAWVGQYNGAITGDVSERLVKAIKEYQKANGGKPTGVLNPKERLVLAETGRRRRENAGWKIVTDAPTGVQLGIRLPDRVREPPECGVGGMQPDRRAGALGQCRGGVDMIVVSVRAQDCIHPA